MAEECTLERVLSARDARLIKQGAEARVYRANTYALPGALVLPDGATAAGDAETHSVLVKHRFLKRYRHPALSASITLARTVTEARSLVRCMRSGVHVPRVEFVDETRGLLGMEWIDGSSVRQWLGGIPEEGEAPNEDPNTLPSDAEQLAVMDTIGEQLARMHCADVIHGDLTTSNMMLRTVGGARELVLIDFGLASVSSFWEDKAVDLYVLERAFASTHPASEHLFHRVLESYAKHTDALSPRKAKKGSPEDSAWKNIHARLQEVRLRGRKRSMVG